jgi:hypothetical protein
LPKNVRKSKKIKVSARAQIKKLMINQGHLSNDYWMRRLIMMSSPRIISLSDPDSALIQST